MHIQMPFISVPTLPTYIWDFVVFIVIAVALCYSAIGSAAVVFMCKSLTAFCSSSNISVHRNCDVWRALWHCKYYRVFKKCNFRTNWFFWKRRDNIHYLKYSRHCAEQLTISNIFAKTSTVLERTAEVLRRYVSMHEMHACLFICYNCMASTEMFSEYLEDFVVNLFLTDENKASMYLRRHYSCDEYELHTQMSLETQRNAGKPLLGSLTPDALVIFAPDSAPSGSDSRLKIAVDATYSVKPSEAAQEKLEKYKSVCNTVLAVACNDDGVLTYRFHGLTDEVRDFLDQKFQLRFKKKAILKNNEAVNNDFRDQLTILSAEHRYWKRCLYLGFIEKPTK